jgi:type IV pilus assembly protein PilA
MFTGVTRSLAGRQGERGFTLVELLIVILIVGILAAVAVPLYLGYTKDAKSAEGKALAGSVVTALQGCVQSKGAGGTCGLGDISGRIGVTTAGVTGDARWTVGAATLTVSTAAAPTFSGTIAVTGSSAADTNQISIGMYPTSTGVVLRCSTTSLTTAIGTGGGEAC